MIDADQIREFDSVAGRIPGWPSEACRAKHRVIEDRGWSYVIGPMIAGRDGPWRYQWEAQEEADRLDGIEHNEFPKGGM